MVVVSSHQKLVAERGSCTNSCEEMSEAAESAGSVEDEADANEVLLEELKKLMRPMSDESIDREAILVALENVEEKKMDAVQILEDLIVINLNN